MKTKNTLHVKLFESQAYPQQYIGKHSMANNTRTTKQLTN